MRTVQSWIDRVPERGGDNTIWDLAWSPDGRKLVVAVGERVLIYNEAGNLEQQLKKAHKNSVFTVDYSRDGATFASGGADCTVIIWTSKGEGVLKYSHSNPIQKLAFNPVTQHLISCTSTDFGLWSPDQKSVQKQKVGSRILTASWTNDGQFVALGMFDGTISIRDKTSKEVYSIERSAPVWTLQWNPSKKEQTETLAVGCWDQTLSFYGIDGNQIGKDKKLDFDPCSVQYYTNGDYIIIGGSNKQVSLWTKEGVQLAKISDHSDWVWAAKQQPGTNLIAVGDNSGAISTHTITFNTVHGLFKDRYAYREVMTDVVVQHLITDRKVRIKCRDYVKKIAVYRDRLAVQLSDRMIIYELTHEDHYDMRYRIKEKILKSFESSSLVVTSLNLILCIGKKLQLLDFHGEKVREWVLESNIRYIKVVGGAIGKEGVLVGLKNGTVLIIYVDNPFPVILIEQSNSIRCLDLSMSHKKLAVIDDTSTCLVYDLLTKELLFKEPNANSVAWNTEMEDMLCFSGNGMLSIKTGNFPLHQQKMKGFVVGFNGSKIFCLHFIAMQTIDVPQSASLYRYLEAKDFDMAFKVACLGVTESDWRLLAISALKSMNLKTAREAFVRIRDIKYIELLNKIEQSKKKEEGSEDLYLADILAHQGKYQAASKIYLKAGHVQKCLEMYCDLRLFDEAKKIAKSSGGIDVNELLQRQALWMDEVGDWRTAANMYVKGGQFEKAIALLGKQDDATSSVIDIARTLDKTDLKPLQQCAMLLRKKFKNHTYAREVYLKLDDIPNLMELHIEFQKWEEAFALAKGNKGNFPPQVFLPYAEWLLENDRFDEAQIAYKTAEFPEKSVRMLEQLTYNAVTENRYGDAGYYYWQLAQEHFNYVHHDFDNLEPEEENHIQMFYDLRRKSEIYFGFQHIHKYLDEPFTALQADALFNIARYLTNLLGKEQIYGISRLYILYTLGKQAANLGAFKLARYAYDKLTALVVPATWRDQVDIATITLQSKPFADKEELLPVCYRCSVSNPLVNNNSTMNKGDTCVNCSHPFERSFLNFDQLPLVEFKPKEGIPDEDAERFIHQEPPTKSLKSSKGANSTEWKEEDHGGDVQTMMFNDNDHDDGKSNSKDMFSDQLLHFEHGTGGAYSSIVVDKETLLNLDRNEVLIVKWPCKGLRNKYYRNMLPELPIIICEVCNHFYHEEDFEFEVLRTGCCPFCRSKTNGPGGDLHYNEAKKITN